MSPEKAFSFLKNNPAFAGVNGILGVLFLGLVLSGGSEGVPSEGPGFSLDTPPINLDAPNIPGLESPLYQRPVFHADRHPAAKPEAPKAVVAEAPFRLELTGVLKVSDKAGWAFLKIAGSEENRQIALGEEIDGWTLEELGENQVTLTREGQTRTLMMENPLAANAQGPAQPGADQTGGPRTRKRK